LAFSSGFQSLRTYSRREYTRIRVRSSLLKRFFSNTLDWQIARGA
jgi:hypothetical protein